MKTNRLFRREPQTSIQIKKRRLNGLLVKAIRDRDYYANITLDKVLELAGIPELDDVTFCDNMKSMDNRDRKDSKIQEVVKGGDGLR